MRIIEDRATTPSKNRHVLRALMALSVLVAVVVPQFVCGRRADGGRRRLVAAVDTSGKRVVTGRLSAGFAYAPVERTRGGLSSSDLQLAAAVFGLKVSPDDPDDARTLAAASLVAGDVDAAITILESTLARETGAFDPLQAITASRDTATLCDLSAAYYERGTRQEEMLDLMSAVESAQRAWNLQRSGAIAFNRALAIESLGLRDEARAAWTDALMLGGEPGWVEEANEHLRRLDTAGRLDEWQRVSASLGELPPGELAALARRYPHEINRHYLLGSLLPRWGAEVVSHDRAGAMKLRALASELATIATKAVADDLLLRVVSSLTDADAPAVVLFGEALAATNAGERVRLLSDAETILRRGRSLFADVVTWERVRSLHGVDDFAGARAEAERLARSTASPWLRAHAETNFGLNILALGQPYEALLAQRRAIAGFRQVGDTAGVIASQNLLAEALDYLGDSDLAWRERRTAMRLLAGEGKAADRLLHILSACGRSAVDSGHHAAAELWFRRLILAARARKASSFEISGLIWRGVVAARSNDPQRAARFFDSADELAVSQTATDHMRSNIDFTRAVSLANSAGDKAEAVERALAYAAKTGNGFRRARLVLERARVEAAAGRMEDAERVLRDGIAATVAEGNTIAEAGFRGRHFDARWELYEELLRIVSRHDVDEAFLIAEELKLGALLPDAARLPAVRAGRYVSVVDADTAVVAYSLLSDLAIVSVLRRGGVVHQVLPLDRASLERDVGQFTNALQRDELPRNAARDLYTRVLAPVAEHLAGVSDLVIIPDGPLNYLPFAALCDSGGRFLVERFVISTSPSMAMYFDDVSPAPPAAQPLVVIGDPAFDRQVFPDLERLPGAESEARAVATMVGNAQLFIGPTATADVVRDACTSGASLHYAGHSAANERRPELSALILAPDGQAGTLPLFELRQLRCRSPLVVFGSCSSALQRSSKAAAASLVSAMLSAGTGAVVGSLWDVNDGASLRFIQFFHRQLAAGQRPATALRAAQVDAISSMGAVPWAVWAAFRISGRKAAL